MNEKNQGGEPVRMISGYPTYLDDPEGLARFRQNVLEARDRHAMAPINLNSLARLIDTIETLRAQLSAFSPSERPEPVACPTRDEMVKAVLVLVLEWDRSRESFNVRLSAKTMFIERHADQIASLYAKPSKQTGGGGETVATEIAERVVLAVCELPDRTSPEDWPEAMLVTGEELHHLVYDAILAALSTNEVAK